MSANCAWPAPWRASSSLTASRPPSRPPVLGRCRRPRETVGGQSAFSFLALAPADPEDPARVVQARALVRVRVRASGPAVASSEKTTFHCVCAAHSLTRSAGTRARARRRPRSDWYASGTRVVGALMNDGPDDAYRSRSAGAMFMQVKSFRTDRSAVYACVIPSRRGLARHGAWATHPTSPGRSSGKRWILAEYYGWAVMGEGT